MIKVVLKLPLFFMFFLVTNTNAEIREITYATPEWKDVTNRDGTGLYHDVMKSVFSARGIKIKKRYVPVKRSIDMVLHSQADIAGGVKKGSYQDKLLYSKYPIYRSESSVLLHKSKLKTWKGIETISENYHKVVIPPLLSKAYGIKSSKLVLNRFQCIKLLAIRRVDYYVDDKKVMNGLIDFVRTGKSDSTFGVEFMSHSSELLKMKSRLLDEFVILDLFTKNLHYVFSNTKRGKEIKKIYDEEILDLYKSGELLNIYHKWKSSSAAPIIEDL